ncbi:hypothetical protein PanWU01x14_238670 [Parasponia andersonii]|uniref:TRF2/HOY1 PH-like domain-containing protein n=1 Tax=Parasponia andersonii TaxID=3476 RepID=A0A2P5BHH5_PARAD|nr:hypothetical protein PanWU01x14_238670 [Parasponia andersonii]
MVYNGGVSSVTEGSSVFEYRISELANHRLNQTTIKSKNQNEMTEVLLSLPPLGLNLQKEQSFLDLIETTLNPQETSNFPSQTNHKPVEFIKKASKLDALFIKIGSWQRIAQHDEDLVAKCYFAKKKLVWEILERGLKSKIEIQWEYIVGMSVSLERNQPGILELELSQPPLFFKETDPQPKRHTLWASVPDFTDGQASICRMHSLQFPPGAYDRHFEKLLVCEPRFLDMCRSPFPIQQSLYFHSNFHNMDTNNISFGYTESKPEINSVQQQQQDPYSGIPTMSYFPDQVQLPIQHNQLQVYRTTREPSIPFDDFGSSTSVRDLSQSFNEFIGNNRVKNARNEALWGQQMTNYGDEIQGLYSTVVTVTSQKDWNAVTSFGHSEGGVYNPLSQFPSGCNENQLWAYSDVEAAANGSSNQFAPLTAIDEAMNNGNYKQVDTTASENSSTDHVNFDPRPMSWFVVPHQQNPVENMAAGDIIEYSSFDAFDFTAMQHPLKEL